jgi:hypothetical protein
VNQAVIKVNSEADRRVMKPGQVGKGKGRLQKEVEKPKRDKTLREKEVDREWERKITEN